VEADDLVLRASAVLHGQDVLGLDDAAGGVGGPEDRLSRAQDLPTVVVGKHAVVVADRDRRPVGGVQGQGAPHEMAGIPLGDARQRRAAGHSNTRRTKCVNRKVGHRNTRTRHSADYVSARSFLHERTGASWAFVGYSLTNIWAPEPPDTSDFNA